MANPELKKIAHRKAQLLDLIWVLFMDVRVGQSVVWLASVAIFCTWPKNSLQIVLKWLC